ncbi:MAG: dTDP-4-dehydrorhamnose 3,5-epimerase [Chloroflexota bacterium]|nr:dTDP-4-dehydrorhamnose 3,5-epimerase [Chloroflexota bacterium]MCY3582857.1 dTDP-4-dehydrorhamnose 3,5-epimerase [Chloroflexota bacterium]MDE2651073.1 dTDP-4-dehydrorhamnose 3,5-epimerase [Chloroflexota bacterium]MXV92120.1 dTDP-4-keto-6-deoxy-D-glucose epimerase [Chloroflexota bacterium]MXX51708.1 dTDP-4-keto-6-deoxy-D-glucose epimerase [Chloroflexota bacterium]
MSQNPARPHPVIRDLLTVSLSSIADARGRFMETFRSEWFPQVSWARLQSNRSDSRASVLRGLHYHFEQVDYWCLISGRIRVGLFDLRRSSPSYLQSATIDLGTEKPLGIFIPVGVAHGFAAHSDCTLLYIVNNYYDGGDEFGVAWDDPQANIDWGLASPQLSARDQANPRLTEIPAAQLPA